MNLSKVNLTSAFNLNSSFNLSFSEGNCSAIRIMKHIQSIAYFHSTFVLFKQVLPLTSSQCCCAYTITADFTNINPHSKYIGCVWNQTRDIYDNNLVIVQMNWVDSDVSSNIITCLFVDNTSISISLFQALNQPVKCSGSII